MAAPPWYPWFPADFANDTRHLSMLQRGAYRDLLDYYYQSNGKLRSDTAGLYRICGAVMPEEQAAVRQVVHEYFADGEPGYLRNTRADLELAKRRETMDSASEKGRKGAAARWQSSMPEAMPEALAGASSGQCSGNAHIHTHKHKQQKHKTNTPLPDGFGVSPEVRSWADREGFKELEAHLAYFRDWALASGKTYRDWDRAFMNAIRGNWARVKDQRGSTKAPAPWAGAK